MRARVYRKDQELLKQISESTGVSMSELVRSALDRALSGEFKLPEDASRHMCNATYVVSYHQEQAVKALAKENNIPMDALIRLAIQDAMRLAREMLIRAEALQTRKEALMDRQEALLDRQERGVAEQSPHMGGRTPLKEDRHH